MTRTILFLPFILAACGETAVPPAQTKVAALQPGLYQVESEITALRAADDGAPRASFEQGDKSSERICIRSADKAGIPAEAVAGVLAAGCETTTLILPSGRITGQFQCKPPGLGGDMSITVSGTHKNDNYEATGQAATYLPTPGDVTADVRTTGRRVGDCPA